MAPAWSGARLVAQSREQGVVFNSLQYAVFLPVVLLIYWRLRHRRQNQLLLAASCLFYGLWDWRFLGLMAISIATDYSVGRALARTDDERRRRRLFTTSLVVNLGILGFFKYFNFFVASAAHALAVFGFRSGTPALNILLPVGISFYTFHGISYTFDVYRREIKPARDLTTFAVFVAYFPQLVAGPIGRAHLQLPQFEAPRTRPDAEKVRSALWLIMLGLLKKVVIADALAPYVARTFNASATSGWVTLLIGMYSFALQIYGDFSGYSDIARGSSRLLGIELPDNFRQPYLSRNIAEFWRTWHISLSTWLRDYLYIPLGGNRGSRWATYRNLMITMVLGGLWHGAAATFVVWGAMHGAALSVHRALTGNRANGPPRLPSRARDIVSVVATFHFVCLAWVLFRAPSFGVAREYLTGLLTLRSGPIATDALALLVPAAALVIGIDVLQRASGHETPVVRWAPALRGAVAGAALVAIVVFAGGTPTPFIYFRF